MPTQSETDQNSPAVELFTDGGCSGNPGPGGWAFLLRHPQSGKVLEKSGGEPDTTNNRMEMLAVIRGLEALKKRCRVRVITDSQYVCKGIREWMPGWKANGWRRKQSQGWAPVKNVDLWQQLDTLLAQHQVEMQWIEGHSGHPENERCDELAVAAYQQFLK